MLHIHTPLFNASVKITIVQTTLKLFLHSVYNKIVIDPIIVTIGAAHADKRGLIDPEDPKANATLESV